MNLKAIVQAKRRQTVEEHKYWIAKYANHIVKYMKRHKLSFDQEIEIEKLHQAIKGEYWADAWIKACNRLYESCTELYMKNQRHPGLPYWNPTQYEIDVRQLAIVDQVVSNANNIVIYEKVKPGDQLFIPLHFTLGGQRSAISSVAPQLKALPWPGEVEELLDIGPTSYVEWCSFGNAHDVSRCHKEYLVWNTSKQCLVCKLCNQRCLDYV